MPDKAAARSDMYAVHEACLARPYVQLEVPSTTIRVRSLELSITSRDQGWGSGWTPCTWHEVHIQRSSKHPGRSHANPIRFYHNPIAVSEFGHFTCRWTCNDPETTPFHAAWVASILPGDTIQIVPLAYGMGWTNIVSEASIKIDYDEMDSDDGAQAGQQSGVLSAADSPQYYGPDRLGRNTGEIRLLVVGPGAFCDPIVAHFETVSLLTIQAHENETTISAPKFWALSYCWGEVSEMTELTIIPDRYNDEINRMRKFTVSQNVVAAIRTLRTPNEYMRIWIDVVCVNQRDVVERSEQVAIMNSIYQSAAEVHVWLGEKGQAVKATLQIIRDTCNITDSELGAVCAGGDKCSCPEGWQHMINREDFLAERERDRAEDEEAGRHVMDKIFQKHKCYFADKGIYVPDINNNNFGLSILMSELFGHPWFWRVWVIQEATLAKEAIVHCGREMLRWKDLMKFHQWLDSPQYRLGFRQKHYQPQIGMPPIWNSLDRTTTDETLGRDLAAHDINPLKPVLDIFLNALDLSASDLRDKLYALLPFGKETFMTTALPLELQPNYEKPLEHVYASFTRWVMRQENSLAVLSLVHCQPTRTWNRILCDTDPRAVDEAPVVARPTWTISGQGLTRFIYSNLKSKFLFRAGSTTAPDRELLEDESSPLTLKVTGYRVGEITIKGYPPLITGPAGGCVYTAPIATDDIPGGFNNFQHVMTGVGIPLIVRLDEPPSSTMNKIPGIQRVFDAMFDPCRSDRFQRSLLSSWAEPRTDDASGWVQKYADHLKSHIGYFPESEIKLLPVLIRETEGSEGSNVMRVDQCHTELIPPCLSESYFVGSGGFVGLCPWPAKEGDIVTLFHGATVPYLLRPVQKADSTEQVPAAGDDHDEYELVGECFVEGIMNGELMDEKLKTGEPPQVFVLV